MTTSTFQKKFQVLNKIGEGSFSEVLKCQNKESNEYVAAKRLRKTFKSEQDALSCPEVTAMQKVCPHPNIIQLIDTIFESGPGRLTLIFELMDMSMFNLIRQRRCGVPEVRARSHLLQLITALDHLHQCGIFHRDVKPENILLRITDGTYGHGEGEIVKLADLGSTRCVYSRRPFTEYISTRWYRSPECLLTNGYYGPKMDVWAVGCVFYELLTLRPLFPGRNEVDQLSRIHEVLGTPHHRLLLKFMKHKSRQYMYSFPTCPGSGVQALLPGVSDRAKEVLKLMLVYDPDTRINCKRLLDHRYFQSSQGVDAGCRTPNSSKHAFYRNLCKTEYSSILSASPKLCRKSIPKCKPQSERCLHKLMPNESPVEKLARESFKSFDIKLPNSKTNNTTRPSLPHGKYTYSSGCNNYESRSKNLCPIVNSRAYSLNQIPAKSDDFKISTLSSCKDKSRTSMGSSKKGKYLNGPVSDYNSTFYRPILKDKKVTKSATLAPSLSINSPSVHNMYINRAVKMNSPPSIAKSNSPIRSKGKSNIKVIKRVADSIAINTFIDPYIQKCLNSTDSRGRNKILPPLSLNKNAREDPNIESKSMISILKKNKMQTIQEKTIQSLSGNMIKHNLENKLNKRLTRR